MNSKEALKRLLLLARPCAYEVREHRNSYCNILEKVIQQDLDRLEQLEKENFELRQKLNTEEECYVMLEKTVKNLKKVICILQTNFFIDLIEREKDYVLGFAPKDPTKEQPRFCELDNETGNFLEEFFMNKYQESLDNLKKIEKDYTFSKIGTRFHVNCDELQELVDKYQEIQNVYFKNEPMESADLNGEKLQELYNFINKLLDKATPKKPIKTQKHKWITNSDGEIDVWQYIHGEYHNGPECEICGYGFCHHCSNKYDNETCDEHYICECGEHLKDTKNYCPNCGQALDWSEKE